MIVGELAKNIISINPIILKKESVSKEIVDKSVVLNLSGLLYFILLKLLVLYRYA